ncbi:PTS glucitol/sorbitol transporter subunit IIA [Chelativorans sp. Marseille-P2723]|uniref:PTS glucitol/sorbitol transporter subunit IIA n=1 Tax=Chelativorans sp. Marseille-P2723 TaxID=2709133 RepID=UPI001570E083|nr:PTS glucitol/sorbitol transporter subunit IIA [Chelativorans sp. Marseille-P2723]
MTIHYKTRFTGIGPEVADLAESGVVILFADGAPPELAEVSVLHAAEGPAGLPPAVGATVRIGKLTATITAMGETAWAKVADMGHVVLSFNGASEAERPGEICAEPVDGKALVAELRPGVQLVIETDG